MTLFKVGCTDASMSNFSYCLLKSRTAVSARFGQGVALPVGIVLTPCVFQNVIQEGVKKAISATTHFGLQECICIHSLKRSCVTGSVPSCCVAPHRRLVAPSRTKKSWCFLFMCLISQWSTNTTSPKSFALTPEKRDLGGAGLSSFGRSHSP